MAVKYPDTHKTREHRITEQSRALITKIVRVEPQRSEGSDGDIVFGNTRNGIKLYVKMNNKWHAFSPDNDYSEEFRSPEYNYQAPSSYTRNRTITGSTSAADTTDVLATLINDLINIGILKKPNKK